MFATMKTKTRILLGAAVSVVLMVILAVVGMRGIQSINYTGAWVNHTHKVLGRADGIISSAVDMETGMRGYLLAGKEEFLEPYNSGEVSTYERIADLQETVSDNPGQVERLGEVEAILREWQANVTEPTIQLRRDIGDADSMNDMAKLVGEARGKTYFDKFRGQIATFDERERVLLKKRSEEFLAAEKAVGDDFRVVTKTISKVTDTHTAITLSTRILANVVDMETGMRGFLLTGEEEFLEPYEFGSDGFVVNVNTISRLVKRDLEQVDRLGSITKIISEWKKTVVEPSLALRRDVVVGSASMDEVIAYVAEKRGKKFFDEVRVIIDEFIRAEKSKLEARKKETKSSIKRVKANLRAMKDTEAWVTHTYKVLAVAQEILAAAVDMETGMRGYLLAGKEEFLEPYNAGQAKFDKLVAGLSETVNDNPAQVQLLGEISTTINDWVKDVTTPTIDLRRSIGDAKTMDDMADLVGEARGKIYFDQFRALMADFKAEEEALMEVRQAEAATTTSLSETTIVGVGLAALVFGLGLAWYLGNSIGKPLEEITKVQTALAGGDLDSWVPEYSDPPEVAALCKAMYKFKQETREAERYRAEQEEFKIETERKQREQVLELASNFETSVGGVIDALTASSTQVSSTTEEVSTFADRTANNSTSVRDSARDAGRDIASVTESVSEVDQAVREVAQQVSEASRLTSDAARNAEDAAGKVQALNDASGKINQIVGLIADIAEQTNLLALNATIEAARAGDAGKGFAVVANEVKSLATQTQQATDEIGAQVAGMLSEISASTVAVKTITEAADKTNEAMTVIASAVEEQAATTNELTRSAQDARGKLESVVSDIDEVADDANATGNATKELQRSSQELARNAKILTSETDEFIAFLRKDGKEDAA